MQGVAGLGRAAVLMQLGDYAGALRDYAAARALQMDAHGGEHPRVSG